MDPSRGVALVGFMGAGKSTVGPLLAARLALPFVDLDEEIERLHGPIDDQIRRDGEAAFRARESAVLGRLAAGPPCVLATGGGAFVDGANRAALAPGFVAVWLRAPLAVHRDRVGAAPVRPLWGDDLEARFRHREVAYAQAGVVVDTEDLSPSQVTDRIVASLEAM